MRHVIIGNGPAGVVAAETLRRLRPSDEIALIGDEPEPPYARMAIPYLLRGEIDEAGTHLRKTHDHYAGLGIHLIQGRVTRLHAAQKEIEFAGGERLGYDRLLIATGAHPLRPAIPGIDAAGVETCWTLQDARAIAARARPGSRVVQLGAGFIGGIVLEALQKRQVHLTLVEAGDRLVPRMMTARAGNLLRRWVEKQGVVVRTSSTVTAIEPAKGALAVKVGAHGAAEETLFADLVVCAAGVAPNVDFLAGSDIALGRGVRVDARMRTSLPDVYAAGDVAEAPAFFDGAPTLNAIQPNAVEQARIAALNMAGFVAESQGALPINVLDTLGLVSASFGQWQGVPASEGGSGVEQCDEAAFCYLSLQFKDDVLIGATAVGHREQIGLLRGLIQGRVRLGAWRERLLADPSQYPAAWLAVAAHGV